MPLENFTFSLSKAVKFSTVISEIGISLSPLWQKLVGRLPRSTLHGISTIPAAPTLSAIADKSKPDGRAEKGRGAARRTNFPKAHDSPCNPFGALWGMPRGPSSLQPVRRPKELPPPTP
jgi:hypothetical protein